VKYLDCYLSCFQKNQIITCLKILLTRYRSVRALYKEIFGHLQKENQEYVSYSQFIRYIKGVICIQEGKEDIFIRFLHNQLNLSLDIIQPNIEIDLDARPIYVNMNRLIAVPNNLNSLAFHVIIQNHLEGKFDAILTHSEAIPFAIAFSSNLQIPWFSLTFRPPSVHPSRVSQYPYLIDQELVARAYFSTEFKLNNKRILIISDYIRRGGLVDILFRIADDYNASIQYLISIIGIGTSWNRFKDELKGNTSVLHYV